jgi:hypothetical protein
MTHANDSDGKKTVRSLRDLPQSVLPSRDLWAGIESQISAEAQSSPQKTPATRRTGVRNPANFRWLAAAAMIATLAVGMWIGRTMLPTPGTTTTAPPPTAKVEPAQPADSTAVFEELESGNTFKAAYFADPKLVKTRAALLKSVGEKFKSLPPDTQQKVIASLRTIHQSMKDLEAALGKDPSNALLQELLVNTYQDEMRVLTTVHEAGTSGEGI